MERISGHLDASIGGQLQPRPRVAPQKALVIRPDLSSHEDLGTTMTPADRFGTLWAPHEFARCDFPDCGAQLRTGRAYAKRRKSPRGIDVLNLPRPLLQERFHSRSVFLAQIPQLRHVPCASNASPQEEINSRGETASWTLIGTIPMIRGPGALRAAGGCLIAEGGGERPLARSPRGSGRGGRSAT